MFSPPPWFKPAGEVLAARYSSRGPWTAEGETKQHVSARVPENEQHVSAAGRGQGSKKLGVKFERKVQNELVSLFGPIFQLGPFLEFSSAEGKEPRLCQPDGLVLFASGWTLIIEIKLAHTLSAWFQLRKLYQPVVTKLNPTRPIRVVEICQLADPQVLLPEPIHWLEDFSELEALVFKPDRFFCIRHKADPNPPIGDWL